MVHFIYWNSRACRSTGPDTRSLIVGRLGEERRIVAVAMGDIFGNIHTIGAKEAKKNLDASSKRVSALKQRLQVAERSLGEDQAAATGTEW